jgi:hypothetical protein
MQWSHVAGAAVILGIVPDFSKASMLTLSNMLKERMDKGLVRNRKEGDHQSAPSWYQGKYENEW